MEMRTRQAARVASGSGLIGVAGDSDEATASNACERCSRAATSYDSSYRDRCVEDQASKDDSKGGESTAMGMNT